MSIEMVLIPVGIAVAQSVSTAINKKKEWNSSYTLETEMKDQATLEKALEQYGCKFNLIEEKNVETEVGELKIVFQKEVDSIYQCIFNQSVSIEDGRDFLNNIQTEYKYIIQQETYQRLLRQAEGKGLILQKEEVDSDRNILLTFQVGN